MGLVNAFYCPEALATRGDLCQVENDPRGFGLTQRAE
jgi:hypothetical protein